MITLRLDIVIDKGTAHGMIWSAVDIAAVRALAVGLLVQLEGGIGTDILDILITLGLAKTARIVGVGATWSRARGIAAHGKILLIAILFVLQISERRRFRHG